MRVFAGIGIGAFVGIVACFVVGAYVGLANGQGVEAGFGFMVCFGWVGVIVGGAIGGLVGLIGSAVAPTSVARIEQERAGAFRALQGDLVQAEQDLDDRETIIRELQAEVARLRQQLGQPPSPPEPR